MPNFSSPKTSLPDLMPVDQDRSPEVSSQELQAIKVNLMETTMRTKEIIDVLIRRNSLLSRDVEKISELKRRLQDTNPIIPSLPGWAGFLLGAGVGAGAVVGGGGGGINPTPIGKVRDKVPTLVPAKAKALKALKAKVSVKNKALKSQTTNALNAVKIKAALPESKLQKVITSTNKSKVLELTEATVDKKILKEKTSKALTSGVNNANNKTNKILKSSSTSGIKSVTPKTNVKGLLPDSTSSSTNNIKKNIKKVDLTKIKTNKLLGSQNIKDWGKKSPLITGLDPRNGEILTKQQRINFKNTGKLPDLKVNASSGSTSKFLSKLKGIRIKPNDVKGLVIGAILNEAADRLILNPFEQWTLRLLVKRNGYDKTYEFEVAELQKQLDKKDHNWMMTTANILTLGIAGGIGQWFGFKDYEMLRQAVRRVKYLQDNESTLRALNNKKKASITPLEGSKSNNQIGSVASVPFNTDSLNLNTRKKDTVVILTDSIA